ncbi:MAG: glycoside hydrolase family 2 TIM barrel-domain containing protein [Eubacterium pyruvativorans]|uniref:glycoside hydrolase family 2 protein n=1 Tax=Eubacterium pyruvativorans TaxID=155865 RepID=UPI00240A8C9A|nr:glycoside hydrolase family 2 TIM barrel-domain containing protein [Eubacterium pyruvativorans]MDD6708360.1 glycoside hydrolase family 2 TIM barrel-domain containing protein [Eubacterium pyruvativorans]
MARKRIDLNNHWKFTENWTDDLADPAYSEAGMQDVRIPHTVRETPLHYFDEETYQMVSGYRRHFRAPEEWRRKTVRLTFEGAAHDSTVYLNGRMVGRHHCGYTAFTVDLSDALLYGEDNVLAVRLDSRESLNVPPFGFVIDYMTYGGIYRNVYLEVLSPSCLQDIFVTVKLAGRYEKTAGGADLTKKELRCARSQTISRIEIENLCPNMKIRQFIRQIPDPAAPDSGTLPDPEEGMKSEDPGEFRLLKEEPAADSILELSCLTGDVKLWDIDQPALYEMKTQLIDVEDQITDEIITRFGFRKARFRRDGFWLNGRKVKIRGLNRHQSYPYVGYAMPDNVQRRDADLLRFELGLNAVRTSHYPQSQAFIDRCDELGLLVFTEIPGWQHIGDNEWKNQALRNLKDMILQYRNHPSIILWGVRINESLDDDEFYARTNRMAHRLDPSRQTGGVRCYKKGSFQEDVFTYNDFSHNGQTKGCEKKSRVTPDMKRPYLISEYNGHMYPTKSFDDEEHRLEHALRHARVLNDVAEQNDICGSFGWSMTDYNTHRDFGSGDRICYHGVTDMFRNRKTGAWPYAIQQDLVPVLEISSSMDIGEHPGSCRGDVYIFTNADSVRMYRNNRLICEFRTEDSPFTHLHHGPILIDDYIGSTMAEDENFPEAQTEELKKVLNQVARTGLYGLPKGIYVSLAKLILRYHMKPQDAVDLYNRYIGDWGSASKNYRFDAVKNGRVVKSVTKAPMTRADLQVDTDRTLLRETRSYDAACIRIRAADENGNTLPYYNDPLLLRTEGPVQLIGPSVISLSGGMGGTYVKTTGIPGEGRLIIEMPSGRSWHVDFRVEV